MALHRIRRGLDLPLAGEPAQVVSDGPEVTRVALVADDFHGLKPRVRVEPGQSVRRGEPICEDAAVPGVLHTAPGAGRVVAVHRGPRRVLHSIVIELSDGERAGDPGVDEVVDFAPSGGVDPRAVDGSEIRALLVRSGLWTALRRRPFSRVPDPGSSAAALFVTAIDTNPLAAEPEAALAERLDDFERGLHAVTKLTDGPTYLCVRPGSSLGDVSAPVRVEEFSGPHPAGTAGVHVHRLRPVGRDRSVWTIGYQDVAAVGALCRTGRLDVRRTISVAGPPVLRPRLVRTRLGAAVGDFHGEAAPAHARGSSGRATGRSAGEVPGGSIGDVAGWAAGAAVGPDGGRLRWISGSVLSGKAADGDDLGYMGRYDVQLSVVREGGERELLAWLVPGLGKFSALPAFASALLPLRGLDVSTDAHGSRRAIIPIGAYERVVPLDILPTFLLRALASEDAERAEELGCLELDEEDLALCSFVDPGKNDFGPMLRRVLDRIERAG